MAITTFAAVDIGSYDISMKIYELSKKYGMHEIDEIRSPLELGKDTYVTGMLSLESLDSLCTVLNDYRQIMEGYRVEDYKVCATSSLREAENMWVILEQIYRRTGMQVEVLSNSEQRFLGYKSIASKEKDFTEIIQKGTAIIEVGGGSVQVSLFDKDALVTTQNFKLGNLRIREKLLPVEKETIYYEQLVEELINNEILSFKKLHLKEREIKNVILVGDNFTEVIFRKGENGNLCSTIDKATFMNVYDRVVPYSPEQVAVEFSLPLEYASLLIPSIIIFKTFIEQFGAETMWIPGTQLTDGMAYEYGESHKIIRTNHNFENDIIEAARNIAKRYVSSKGHVQVMTRIGLAIFDSMKKYHGMGKRERLLLQIAIILHDCGKYISLSNVGECSYNIIMSTEIIGLSHAEREVIANVVRFNTVPYVYYGEDGIYQEMKQENYILVGKLTAILRMANALDRSHLQKIETLHASVKENRLILSIESQADFTLEEGLLADKINFFEEIYFIRPELRRKRRK
ncbi:exopolyphosphatase [Lactonifactor longoviformis]|uniref:Exopolyphosphatase / guanosine-5'-triphosphate,3'-diphosphate pyrophosphatase n=1 Tax=Lactonifactor longoviformis DSM 17459 TaxID=1122155 RepID=A0A1M5D343_9CLOT|nr:exopolyphosphatase [Lactonifactor longoviformis]POP30792.1 exopolyphosphatase [Lactonifactor longoviformis]SHF61374.1 exopolyphosphatase / guanosine-5'-triphosphate,3'-diphosphate pyrophosphatase [Lactonifactor longoviformis DSM 17459]